MGRVHKLQLLLKQKYWPGNNVHKSYTNIQLNEISVNKLVLNFTHARLAEKE